MRTSWLPFAGQYGVFIVPPSLLLSFSPPLPLFLPALPLPSSIFPLACPLVLSVGSFPVRSHKRSFKETFIWAENDRSIWWAPILPKGTGWKNRWKMESWRPVGLGTLLDGTVGKATFVPGLSSSSSCTRMWVCGFVSRVQNAGTIGLDGVGAQWKLLLFYVVLCVCFVSVCVSVRVYVCVGIFIYVSEYEAHYHAQII